MRAEDNALLRARSLPWHHAVVPYYFFTHVCLALEKVGFFELLASDATLGIKELAARLGVNENMLRHCVEFLWSVSDVVERNGDRVSLADKDLSEKLWILAAYKPVFDGLDELLAGEKKYGVDVARDGYYLQKAADTFSGDAVGRALRLIQDEPGATLVDLGCGSASSLIAYRKAGGRRGIGIDVDPVIVREARNRIAAAGARDAITILENDVLNIMDWKREIPGGNTTVFLASTVLHEFLRDGREPLVRFLADMKAAFPRSRFLVVEFDAASFEEIREEQDSARRFRAATYALWHPLTNQGLPQPRRVWEEMFEEAGWKVAGETRAKYDLVIYDIR